MKNIIIAFVAVYFLSACSHKKPQNSFDLYLKVDIAALVQQSADTGMQPPVIMATANTEKIMATDKRAYLVILLEQFHKLNIAGNTVGELFSAQRAQTNVPADERSVALWLNGKLERAMNHTSAIIKSRLQATLSDDIKIDMNIARGYIHVSGKNRRDIAALEKLLCKPCKVDFYNAYENAEILPLLLAANDTLAGPRDTTTVKASFSDTGHLYTGLASDKRATVTRNPLFALLQPCVDKDGVAIQGPVVGMAMRKDLAAIDTLLHNKRVAAVLTPHVKILHGLMAERDSIAYLYGILIRSSDRGTIINEDIIRARADYNELTKKPAVYMEMSPAGTLKWARMTKASIGRHIAVVIDEEVLSCPRVQGEITGGGTEISGNFTFEVTEELAAAIGSGNLPYPVSVVRSNVKQLRDL